MIPRPRPERVRLRRTMMFMNAQRPGLIKDAYIYGVDSIILDLEDAVAENQKDAARFSLYHALKSIDYGETEVLVRMNGLETPHWQEDIRVCVAGGADGVRIAKCESADDVKYIEEHGGARKSERDPECTGNLSGIGSYARRCHFGRRFPQEHARAPRAQRHRDQYGAQSHAACGARGRDSVL